jgi:hypothetical protein
VVAFLLVILLTVIAYKAEDPIAAELTVFIVALSVLPAPITLGLLWLDATIEIRPIMERADKLESLSLKRR